MAAGLRLVRSNAAAECGLRAAAAPDSLQNPAVLRGSASQCANRKTGPQLRLP